MGEIKTHFMFKNFFPKVVPIWGIMWKNIVEPVWPQMTIWRLRVACWIPKSTNTHSECVILIAFPLQQWLHKCVPKLRSMHIARLVASGQQRLHHTQDCLATTAGGHKFPLLVGKIFRAEVFLFEMKPWSQSTDRFSRITIMERLRWSRGSVLAFSTQVRGFKPGRILRIFRAKKSSARLPSEGK